MFTDKSTQILYPKEEVPSHDVVDIVQTNIFNVMLNRRSQRKFENKKVEEWKLEKLVEAANNQPYVNAPVVLVFCMNPKRVKLNFPTETIRKFSQQDATLAAAYSQLAAHALGLSSIWIGMLDENKLMEILRTDLSPSSILCLGYPVKMLVPKPKRNLKDLIHEI